MVKNRKPLMVSEEALRRLKALANTKNIFVGDLVDTMVGVKSNEEIEKEYELKPHISKRLRKGHAGDGHESLDGGGLGV